MSREKMVPKDCGHGRSFKERCIECELVSAREGLAWAEDSFKKYSKLICKLEEEQKLAAKCFVSKAVYEGVRVRVRGRQTEEEMTIESARSMMERGIESPRRTDLIWKIKVFMRAFGLGDRSPNDLIKAMKDAGLQVAHLSHQSGDAAK